MHTHAYKAQRIVLIAGDFFPACFHHKQERGVCVTNTHTVHLIMFVNTKLHSTEKADTTCKEMCFQSYSAV